MQAPTTPASIAEAMTGRLLPTDAGRLEGILPSPCIQNHAAFLCRSGKGLQCLWFGGSLEGKSDIAIWRSLFAEDHWSEAEQISHDTTRSEQNPVQFCAADGQEWLFNTAQAGGNQDECVIRMGPVNGAQKDLPLPKGSFIRGAVQIRPDNAWLLPLFRCVQRPGAQWTGSDDTAAVAITADQGVSWREVNVPESPGCVHMSLVELGRDHYAAFFRRRQADFVYRSESLDGGEHWSVPVSTGVPNNNSSISVIKLSDGRIAMACNPVNAKMHPHARRSGLYDELGDDDQRPQATGGCNPIWGVPRAPMSICLSSDAGHSFKHCIEIETGEGSCLSNNSTDGENREMSYPSLLQAPDGTLDLAYTYHRRAIKHVRLLPEWLDKQ